MSNFELSLQFFLQLAFILAACQAVGLIAKRFKQPQVVAEMLTGVLLGPSLFGQLLPELQQQLFPKAGMPIIYTVSQVGLVLYMFLVGLEFRKDIIRTRFRSALWVSLTGIVVPFSLGGLCALLLAQTPGFFPPGLQLWQILLFLGAAMAITAFPVLARIIHEHGLTGTAVGTLTLAAGSIDDAAAWCVLAVVLASFGNDTSIALAAIGGGALYAAGILLVGRPLLSRLGRIAETKGMQEWMFSLVLLLLLLSAWFTDRVGIHAVFGAFILGTAMPRGIVTRELQRFLEPLTRHLLVPLFFVYSGLNTQIGLLNTPYLWLIAILILLAASLGKGAACWLAARLNGETQQDALTIGALMNARGMMELIILNIGLERGIITPTLFTIMVLMALVTTLMASPLFFLVYRRPEQVLAPAPSMP